MTIAFDSNSCHLVEEVRVRIRIRYCSAQGQCPAIICCNHRKKCVNVCRENKTENLIVMEKNTYYIVAPLTLHIIAIQNTHRTPVVQQVQVIKR